MILAKFLLILSLMLSFACNRESENSSSAKLGLVDGEGQAVQASTCHLPGLISDFWQVDEETVEKLFDIAEKIDPQERNRLMQKALQYLQRYGRRRLFMQGLQDIQNQ